MARIRTIKPEFPQSESMGRVSRDARLCFIELWTIADDSGRLRGSSRMLASLLFPYDDDAPGLMDAWLSELEKESCICRYSIEFNSYIQICKWQEHQKIDKPSPSKIPQFVEGSRILPEPSRSVVLGGEGKGRDQGEDQGPGRDTRETHPPSAPVAAEVVPSGKKPKKPPKPRNRDFLIAALEMPEPVAAAFNRTWYGWAPLGWNFKTNSAGNRKTNRVEAAKRFWEICQHMSYTKADGSIVGPEDLADAALADIARRIKEAPGGIPCVSGVVNFFSSCEGEKHPWKDALVSYFDAFEEVL